MAYMRLTMDGTTYRVRVRYDTYIDSFQLIEGPNAGDMLSGRHERDLVGSSDTYEMAVEPDWSYPSDFDAFYDALRAPVDSHTITVLDGQNTVTYEAMIQSGQRTYKGLLGGVHRWAGMVVRFVPVTPQREAE